MNSVRLPDLSLVALWIVSIALAVAVTLLFVEVSAFEGGKTAGNRLGDITQLATPRGSVAPAPDALPTGSYEVQSWTGDRLIAAFLLDTDATLVLTDQQGTERVAITFDELTRTPQVALSDDRGDVQAILAVDETGPWVAILDEQGESDWIPLTSYQGSDAVLAGHMPEVRAAALPLELLNGAITDSTLPERGVGVIAIGAPHVLASERLTVEAR